MGRPPRMRDRVFRFLALQATHHANPVAIDSVDLLALVDGRQSQETSLLLGRAPRIRRCACSPENCGSKG
jgi:hypothetical protein